MNRSLLITACTLLAACALVVLFLLLDRDHDARVERTESAAPKQISEDWAHEVPALDREPMDGNAPPDENVDRPNEPEPPDAIRSKAPGWWIWGLVREPDYSPVADAKVALELIRPSFDGNIEHHLQPTRTDPQGRYTLKIDNTFESPGLAASGSLPLRVVGRATAAGYIRPHSSDSDFWLDAACAHFSHRFDFLLVKGCALRGSVREPDGAPAAGATVHLYDPATGQKTGGSSTDVDGEYCMNLWAPGAPSPVPAGSYALLAAKRGVGFSQSVAVAVETGKDIEAPLLTLREYGAIAGRVVRPDGTPVEGIEIYACPLEWFEENDGEVGGAKRGIFAGRRTEYDLKTVSRGHFFGTATTGPDGRFRVAGLRPGAYMLQVSLAEISRESGDQEIGDLLVPCETGDSNVRIELCRYELRVIVLDEQGLKIPMANLTCSCAEAMTRSQVTGGEATIKIAPGHLSLKAWTEEGLLANHQSIVPVGSYRNEVTLVLQKKSLGRLCLRVHYHDGRPVKRETPLRLMIHGNGFFDIIPSGRIEWDKEGRAFVDCPPGRYDIQVEEEISIQGSDPGKMSLPVIIRGVNVTDEENEVPVKLGTAGRLRLTLHFSGPVDRPWDIALTACFTDSERGETHSLDRFYCPRKNNSLMGKMGLEPDTPYITFNLLIPGAYRLDVKAEGFEDASAPFMIRADTVTDLELWLVPGKR